MALPLRFEYIPQGWDTTLIDNSGSWDSEIVVKKKVDAWPQQLDSIQSPNVLAQTIDQHNLIITFGYVASLVAQRKKVISILDWGGGFGWYYNIAKSLLPDLVIDYHCRDVNEMVAAGRKLNPDVTFHNDDQCFDREYDLTMANGAISYSPDWKKTLSSLAQCSSKYIYLSKDELHDAATTFAVLDRAYHYDTQNGHNMLIWFFNRSEYLFSILKDDFRLVREFKLMQFGYDVSNAPDQNRDRHGFLFRRDDKI
jgi:putative methyltransferase (TIGR04325 family)